MTKKILLSPPDTGAEEEEAVLRALRSGWVAPLGPEVDAFEREIAIRTNRRHAVALASGTAALHLAMLAHDVGAGDYVVTSTLTFAATANAITYSRATPVFIDSDATGNMDTTLLQHALTDLEAKGRRAAAIVPVDLLGKVADYGTISAIAAQRDIPVIADAAESLGARREGEPAGSFGRAAILSFNGNKIMTTSGGGMLVTDDSGVADRARYLATQARQPVAHYQHNDIGYNYRLSNLLAAVGRAQLAKLDAMIEQRRRHRNTYRDLLSDLPGITFFGQPDSSDDGTTSDNFWLTSIIVDKTQAGITATEMVTELNRSNIEARPLWKPMHLQPVYAESPSYLNGCSEALFRNGLSLPSGSKLSEADIRSVAQEVRALVRTDSMDHK